MNQQDRVSLRLTEDENNKIRSIAAYYQIKVTDVMRILFTTNTTLDEEINLIKLLEEE